LDSERSRHIASSCRGKERASPNSNGARDDATAAERTGGDVDWPRTGGGPAPIGYQKRPTLNRGTTRIDVVAAEP